MTFTEQGGSVYLFVNLYSTQHLNIVYLLKYKKTLVHLIIQASNLIEASNLNQFTISTKDKEQERKEPRKASEILLESSPHHDLQIKFELSVYMKPKSSLTHVGDISSHIAFKNTLINLL